MLTGGDSCSFRKIPSFDAGDQFALVIHSVSPDQGGFSLPTFWKTENGAAHKAGDKNTEMSLLDGQ